MTVNSVCSSAAGGRSRRRRRPARAAHRGGRDRDVELALEGFDQLGELEDGHVADRVEDLVLAHGRLAIVVSLLKCSQGILGRVMVRRTPGNSCAFALRLQRFERSSEHSSAGRSSRRANAPSATAVPRRARRASARATASTPARLTCAASIAAALEHAALHRRPLIVRLREVGEDLRRADRILRDDEARRAPQPLANETALVHGAQRERVLDDDVLHARLAEAAAQLASSASRSAP